MILRMHSPSFIMLLKLIIGSQMVLIVDIQSPVMFRLLSNPSAFFPLLYKLYLCV